MERGPDPGGATVEVDVGLTVVQGAEVVVVEDDTPHVDVAPTEGAGPDVATTVVVPEQRGPGPQVHLTQLAEQGPFVVARCPCGWRSPARRSRPKARAEGRDHEAMHGA